MDVESRDWDKTVFIAHASEDRDFAKHMYDQFMAAGLEPWLAPESIGPGAEWDSEIKIAINKTRFFMACFSSNSKGKDGYIQRELRQALSKLEEKPPGFIYFIPAIIEPNITLPDISVETIKLSSYQSKDITTLKKQTELIRYLLQQIEVVQKVVAKETPEFKNIRHYIMEGQIDTAFRLLKEQEEKTGSISNDVILIMGRYNNIKKQNMMNLISSEQYTIQNNQIVYALLEMIKVLEERGGKI